MYKPHTDHMWAHIHLFQSEVPRTKHGNVTFIVLSMCQLSAAHFRHYARAVQTKTQLSFRYLFNRPIFSGDYSRLGSVTSTKGLKRKTFAV